MKISKQLTVLLFITTLLCVSCNKDDSNDGDTSASFLGSWRLTKEIDKETGTPDDVYIVPSGCNEVLLNISGSTLESIEDYDCDGTTDDTSTVAYTKSGNTVTANGQSVEITTLNATTLIFVETESNTLSYTQEYERL